MLQRVTFFCFVFVLVGGLQMSVFQVREAPNGRSI